MFNVGSNHKKELFRIITVFFSVSFFFWLISICLYCQIANGSSIKTVICSRHDALISGGIESTWDKMAPADETPTTPAANNPHTRGGVRLIIMPRLIQHPEIGHL